MSGDLARLTTELAVHDDPTEYVLALCEAGLAALTKAGSLEEASAVLGAVSTLEHATKAAKLSGEACVAASVLRVRAERRIGQLIVEERSAGRLAKRSDRRASIHVVDRDDNVPATLSDHGISRDQAAEYARLAAPDEATFDEVINDEKSKVAEKGHNVTRAGVLRRINPEVEKRPDERWLEADRFVTAAKRMTALVDPFVNAVRFGAYPGEMPLVGRGVDDILHQAATAIEQARTEMRRKK